MYNAKHVPISNTTSDRLKEYDSKPKAYACFSVTTDALSHGLLVVYVVLTCGIFGKTVANVSF
jgi:hypothetical protein